MKIKTTSPILVALGATLLLSLTLAACHRHRQEPDMERGKRFLTWLIDDHLEEIEATEDQQRQIHAIRDRVFVRVEELMVQHKRERAAKALAILVEVQKDQPDPEKLHQMVDEGLKRHGELAHEAVDTLLEIHAVLTPAQRRQLGEKLAKRLGAK